MKKTMLAKEREGSIIEVVRHDMPKRRSGFSTRKGWQTLDGNCWYEHGSFEWIIPLSILLKASSGRKQDAQRG